MRQASGASARLAAVDPGLEINPDTSVAKRDLHRDGCSTAAKECGKRVMCHVAANEL